MKRNRLIFGWHDFLEKVEQRFGTTHFEDPLAELAKLTKVGTVVDFQAAFEKLLNRVTGVNKTQLVSYVIGGLKSHIRRELLMVRPRTILAAFEMAKAHEARYNELMLDCCTAYNEKPRPPVIHEDNRWQPRGSNFSQVTIRSSSNSQPNILPSGKTNARGLLPAPMAQPTQALPIRRYTSAEIREKRDKGLCFRCDEKYTPGHRCKGRFLVLIGDEDDKPLEDDPMVVNQYHTDEEVISGDVSVLNTMTGPGSPRSLRLIGNIKGSSCMVLIDSGSTHNFITPAIAERLHLPTKAIKPFQVYIGNDDTLGCRHVCPVVEVCMQGFAFAMDLHVLRIVGLDVVLGVQWLQSLGSVTHDYSKMTMEFQMGSINVKLKGDSGLNNQPISFNQLQAMVTNGAIQTLYEIHHINTTDVAEPTQMQPTPPTLPEPFRDLLLEFSPIFEPPKSLPPHRVFDHNIHLLPNSKPVNVRPYRYPYFQKYEIEKLVREMFEQGIVRPSRSPFSSPILLVQKKDGTYRFCMDYRALNAITVQDKFPIPTADELFDELGGATIFSKLGLQAGYHQIRVADEDIFKTVFRTHERHYELLVMPFGLTNAPSTFQAAMNTILRPFLRRYVIVFFDDILIYSSSME
ncbi:PREDICTED: uncharacterized protein LOC109154433 [Ipomoea nil]|uniref:uncharacterized protein LOC109154433 n=1 Tax=Ipomoea nil TaxID=35883 RepID=UPI0009009080|nr:PREDICTED: uncharacterized protein LOC109154433 [Ipomoea nil]